MKNAPGDIIILYMPTKNNDHMTYGSWDMVRDGQTDRQSNWHIEAGVPPKNKYCKNRAWIFAIKQSRKMKNFGYDEKNELTD